MEKEFEVIKESVPGPEAGTELMSRMFTVTRPDAVFGEPVTQGEYTVVTASEVSVNLGFGYGGGGGVDSQKTADGTETGEAGNSGSYGGGGGGGGAASARPVAVIEIGPQGVRVEPIVDPTKIVLAFFTAFGAMFMMAAKMRRQASD